MRPGETCYAAITIGNSCTQLPCYANKSWISSSINIHFRRSNSAVFYLSNGIIIDAIGNTAACHINGGSCATTYGSRRTCSHCHHHSIAFSLNFDAVSAVHINSTACYAGIEAIGNIVHTSSCCYTYARAAAPGLYCYANGTANNDVAARSNAHILTSVMLTLIDTTTIIFFQSNIHSCATISIGQGGRSIQINNISWYRSVNIYNSIGALVNVFTIFKHHIVLGAVCIYKIILTSASSLNLSNSHISRHHITSILIDVFTIQIFSNTTPIGVLITSNVNLNSCIGRRINLCNILISTFISF